MPTTIDPSDGFGHWLAGLIDGEGSFTLQRRHGGRGAVGYYCAFQLSLRDDDEAVLREIVDRVGLGRLYHRTRKPSTSGKAGATNPQYSWMVTGKHDLAALVAILDEYPLRSKKARDFAVWREAVMWWVASIPSPTRPRGTPAYDWTPMADMAQRLRDGRAYQPAAA